MDNSWFTILTKPNIVSVKLLDSYFIFGDVNDHIRGHYHVKNMQANM